MRTECTFRLTMSLGARSVYLHLLLHQTSLTEACLIPWSKAVLENLIRTFWASKEIFCLLIGFWVLLKCLLIPIASQINSIHTLTASLFRINYAIILQSNPAFSSSVFSVQVLSAIILHFSFITRVLRAGLPLCFDRSKPAIQKSGTPRCHGV